MIDRDTATVYVITDDYTAWGVGRDAYAAMKDAAQWIEDADGRQGVSLQELESLICSGRYAVEKVTGVQWDDSLVGLEPEALIRLLNQSDAD